MTSRRTPRGREGPITLLPERKMEDWNSARGHLQVSDYRKVTRRTRNSSVLPFETKWIRPEDSLIRIDQGTQPAVMSLMICVAQSPDVAAGIACGASFTQA